MLKARYEQSRNIVVVEFQDKVDAAEADSFYPQIEKIVPKNGKGFKLLTDFTLLEKMDPGLISNIKKTMDFFNERGVTHIYRVVPTPDHDIGFNILSVFHYSKHVKVMTLQTRQEAEERVWEDSR